MLFVFLEVDMGLGVGFFDDEFVFFLLKKWYCFLRFFIGIFFEMFVKLILVVKIFCLIKSVGKFFVMFKFVKNSVGFKSVSCSIGCKCKVEEIEDEVEEMFFEVEVEVEVILVVKCGCVGRFVCIVGKVVSV